MPLNKAPKFNIQTCTFYTKAENLFFVSEVAARSLKGLPLEGAIRCFLPNLTHQDGGKPPASPGEKFYSGHFFSKCKIVLVSVQLGEITQEALKCTFLGIPQKLIQ